MDNLLKIEILPPTDTRTLWTVMSYNLADYLGCESTDAPGFRDSYKAEAMVQEYYRERAGLIASNGIEFASEMGCFFAYAKNYDDAIALVGHIYLLASDHYRQSTHV